MSENTNVDVDVIEQEMDDMIEKTILEEFNSMKFNDPIFKKIKQDIKPVFGLHYTCDQSTFRIDWESADAREKSFDYFKKNK